MRKIKCIVPTCPNHSDAGAGIYIKYTLNNLSLKEKIIGVFMNLLMNPIFICQPCWKTIHGKGDKHSWLYKSCTGFKK